MYETHVSMHVSVNYCIQTRYLSLNSVNLQKQPCMTHCNSKTFVYNHLINDLLKAIPQ